jgi:hypothetical protein
MLPYSLIVSTYTLIRQVEPTFALCSLICLTFDTYSSASNHDEFGQLTKIHNVISADSTIINDDI